MSRKSVIKNGHSTWVGSGKPNLTHAGDNWIRMDQGTRRGLLWMRNPVPRGRAVMDAEVVLTEADAGDAGAVLSLTRLAGAFQPRTATWADQPDIVAGTAVAGVKDGNKWRFDVSAHLQDVANGAKWYGWRVTTTSATLHSVKGTEAAAGAPVMRVEFGKAPQTPTDLTPASGAVSAAQPTLTCDFTDNSGSTDMAAMRVQVATDEAFTALWWDSGTVNLSEPVLDTATAGMPALTAGVAYRWRAQVKDGAGLWSEWSDDALLQYAPLGSIALTGGVGSVTDHTPTVTWSVTGGQVAFRLTVDDLTRAVTVYDSGRITAGVTAHAIPEGVIIDSRAMQVRVRVWDGVDRDPAPGARTYVEAVSALQFTDGTSQTPTGLTVTQSPAPPFHARLSWSSPTMPDYWVIERDGVVIDALVDAAETATGASTYEWEDETSGRSHTYRVRGVYDAASPVANTSAASASAVFEKQGTMGVWLGSRQVGWVRLAESNLDGLVTEDTATVYKPVGARVQVRIVSGMTGYTGPVAGVLFDRPDGYTRAEGMAALRTMKANPGGVYRLIGANLNIGVNVGDLTWRPEAKSTVSNRREFVQCTVWQVNGFDWERP